jgi:hypothetical protein
MPTKTNKKQGPTIVTIQFRVSLNADELEAAFAKDAPMFADLPGLAWKIWSHNPEERSFVGVYLFATRKIAEDYLAGPIVRAIGQDPNLGDVDARLYPVVESLSRVTHAPIQVPKLRTA